MNELQKNKFNKFGIHDGEWETCSKNDFRGAIWFKP